MTRNDVINDVATEQSSGGHEPFGGKTADEVFKNMLDHAETSLPIYADVMLEGFRNYVASNPLECSEKSIQLINAISMVQHEFFSGLEDSMQDQINIDWNGVIPLIDHIIERNSEVTPICYLLRKGFQNDRIDFELKYKMWGIIEKLVEIGSSHKARGNYPQDRDSLTISINSIGGLSFHILSRYALWCTKHEGNKLLAPEIKEIFDGYMNDHSTHTISRHAVLGLFFTNFYHVYEDWARNILEKIVPGDDSTSVAFWDAHVNYNKLHRSTFDVLYRWYDKFLNQRHLGNEVSKKIHRSTINHMLLAYFYDLPRADVLFEGFLDNANNDSDAYEDSIEHCVLLVGMIISGKKDDSEFHKDRLIQLWNRPCIIRHDLTRWFENSPLDKKETISLYLDYLQQYDKPLHLFSRDVNMLKEYVDDYPCQVVGCLDEIVKKLEFNQLHDEIKDILKCLLNHDDDGQIREKCICIIDTIIKLDDRCSNFYGDLL